MTSYPLVNMAATHTLLYYYYFLVQAELTMKEREGKDEINFETDVVK